RAVAAALLSSSRPAMPGGGVLLPDRLPTDPFCGNHCAIASAAPAAGGLPDRGLSLLAEIARLGRIYCRGLGYLPRQQSPSGVMVALAGPWFWGRAERARKFVRFRQPGDCGWRRRPPAAPWLRHRCCPG